MDQQVTPGLTGRAEMVVGKQDTAIAHGSGKVEVLATPAMVALMEKAALVSVEPFLGSDQTTVGTGINIRHLSATPVGMRVRAEAELTAVEGKRLIFKVAAYDEREMIGAGTHERYIVEKGRFLVRVAGK